MKLSVEKKEGFYSRFFYIHSTGNTFYSFTHKWVKESKLFTLISNTAHTKLPSISTTHIRIHTRQHNHLKCDTKKKSPQMCSTDMTRSKTDASSTYARGFFNSQRKGREKKSEKKREIQPELRLYMCIYWRRARG